MGKDAAGQGEIRALVVAAFVAMWTEIIP